MQREQQKTAPKAVLYGEACATGYLLRISLFSSSGVCGS